MEPNPVTSLKVWPLSYENRDYITKPEKELARLFESKISEGHLVLQAHPSTQNGKVRVSFYMHDRRGLLAMLLSDSIDPQMLLSMDAILSYRADEESRLYQRLLDAKQLVSYLGDKKLLKFPFRLVYVFLQLGPEDLCRAGLSVDSLEKSGAFFCEGKKGQRRSSPSGDKMLDGWFSNLSVNFDTAFTSMSEADKKAVIERLSPEYAIVLPEKEKVEVNDEAKPLSEELYSISGNEHEFKTFSLDDEQVEMVNDIRRGHQLILANAGAGKSVILLAKSYRIANLFPRSNVLLTCYNKNLAQTYMFKKEIAGFNQRTNLFVDTFHAFVRKLDPEAFRRNGLSDFDKTIDSIQKKVDVGVIKCRFKAIFIDEAQIFQPKWIDLCYSLLEPGTESFFVIAGDLNQDVQNKCKRGKAVWQQAKLIPSPGFRGRVRYLRKNYRNSKEICDYLNKMLDFMIARFSSLNVIDRSEYDYIVHGETSRSGHAPVIKKIGRAKVTESIIEQIKWLHLERKVPFNEIAVVFPFKQVRSKSYYILKWVEDCLGREGIPYSIIIQDDQDACRYVEADGVILSTIDSTLGLDFRAIILAGLYPIDYMGSNGGGIFQEKLTWQDVLRNPDLQQQYVMQMRKIYTACSRAREYLVVLNDLEANSPFSDLINVNNGGVNYGY